MKTFRRIQAGVAIVALWTAIAICDSYETTIKEYLASVVLVALAGMVIVSVLIERAKEETK
ncbi:MAG: hypothetical protein RRZ65_08075 [Tannerellaceae bacterium]